MSRLISSVIVLLLVCNSAHAVLVNLITNGEFESPTGTPNWFDIHPNGSVPGWTGSGGSMEIWTQGIAAGQPTLGSDGMGTGQQVEVNVFFAPESISQSVVVPMLLTPDVVLSFDAWLRDIGGSAVTGSYSVVGSTSGALISSTPIVMNTMTWTLNTSALFMPIPGETLTVSFTSTGDAGNSTHIDQVALVANAVPESASMVDVRCCDYRRSAISVARRLRSSACTVQ